VVTDILDPATGDFADEDETLTPGIFVEDAIGAVFFDFGNATNDEVTFAWCIASHSESTFFQARVSVTVQPTKLAFPPLGEVNVLLHTKHEILVVARLKMVHSDPQSLQATLKNPAVIFSHFTYRLIRISSLSGTVHSAPCRFRYSGTEC
jgi:hypothetical protein